MILCHWKMKGERMYWGRRSAKRWEGVESGRKGDRGRKKHHVRVDREGERNVGRQRVSQHMSKSWRG